MTDPITVAIIAAAVAGAASGTTTVVSSAIVDAYGALKNTIQRKFGTDSDLPTAMEKLAKNPESNARREVVKEEVAATNANTDPELLQLAQDLIKALQTSQAGQTALRQVNVYDSEVGVIGDHAHIEGGIKFDQKSESD